MNHSLLGCRTYRNERKAVEITRETTLHSLLFTSSGITMLQDFIKSTKVATRGGSCREEVRVIEMVSGGGED